MKLTKVHRSLKFKQSDWLRHTLILIQRKGKMQLIILKKNYFKPMNNSVFGKKNGESKEKNKCQIG